MFIFRYICSKRPLRAALLCYPIIPELILLSDSRCCSLRRYGAFQRPDMGFADGIMCAMSELSVDGGIAVPSCGNKLLLT